MASKSFPERPLRTRRRQRQYLETTIVCSICCILIATHIETFRSIEATHTPRALSQRQTEGQLKILYVLGGPQTSSGLMPIHQETSVHEQCDMANHSLHHTHHLIARVLHPRPNFVCIYSSRCSTCCKCSMRLGLLVKLERPHCSEFENRHGPWTLDTCRGSIFATYLVFESCEVV